jgi:hypothetical protein
MEHILHKYNHLHAHTKDMSQSVYRFKICTFNIFKEGNMLWIFSSLINISLMKAICARVYQNWRLIMYSKRNRSKVHVYYMSSKYSIKNMTHFKTPNFSIPSDDAILEVAWRKSAVCAIWRPHESRVIYRNSKLTNKIFWVKINTARFSDFHLFIYSFFFLLFESEFFVFWELNIIQKIDEWFISDNLNL